MRVYHLISEEWGLDDIRKRRLKISKIDELNDPFELLGVDLSDQELRNAFRLAKRIQSREKGIICFSKSWKNPVLWSHYADSHKGLCLGFDVPDDKIVPIYYSSKRISVSKETILTSTECDKELDRALRTKFLHWKYENEVRCQLSLPAIDPETRKYYANFDDTLEFKEVIIGAESELDKKTLLDALGNLKKTVEITKARCAFRTFRVVPLEKKSLWYN